MDNFFKKSIGVDVGKDDLFFCICGITALQEVKIKGTRKLPNTPAGIKEALLWVSKHSKEKIPLTITMEATGIYHERLALALQRAGYRISVILPNKARSYMKSLGLQSKTDSIDAKGLARMGAEQHLKVWEPRAVLYYELRLLTRHYEDMQKTITSYSNRLHAMQRGMYRHEQLEKSLQEFISQLQSMAKEAEANIQTLIKADDYLSAKMGKLTSIKGVALLSAATVVAETNGFALFENVRQLESYAGYNVIEDQSGKRRGKTKISKKGNSHIRRILHMPALNMVTYEVAPFANLYSRVHNSSKIKMKGYVAVQRKLLGMLYTLWKNDCFFNTAYTKTIREEEPKSSFVLASKKP
jgi:transposase